MARIEPWTPGNSARPAGSRLWSLWDMISSHVGQTVELLRSIQAEETLAALKAKPITTKPSVSDIGLDTQSPTPPTDKTPRNALARAMIGLGAAVDQMDRGRLVSFVDYWTKFLTALELEAALDRIVRLRNELSSPLTDYKKIEGELRVLRETIEDGVKKRYCYYYPVKKADMVVNIQAEWGPVLKAYNKTAWREVFHAVDCYALGQPTASVFHLMRLAEHGLRALAREAGVKLKHPLEWAEWNSIIIALKKKTAVIATKSRGDARARQEEFYHSAISHFEAFKDVYRNNVMHTRKEYNDTEAERVLSQVRVFMLGLSRYINEDTKRKIAWGKIK